MKQLLLVGLLVRFVAPGFSLLIAQQPAPAAPLHGSSGQWVASWATSQQAPEPQNNQPGMDAAKLTDMTIRQIVHLSAGGAGLRVRLSNAFGTQPLVVDAAHIALATAAGASAIQPGSDRALSFAGRPGVTIPIGADFVSDPVDIAVKPLTNLAISMHLPQSPVGQTAHPGAHATSFLATGNHVAETDLPGAEKVVRWFQMSEVDVTGAAAQTVVAFGDSITDGHGSTTDGNDRWPDVLAARLQSASVAVANEGIGGNHLLTNGLGENALQRLDRDLFGVSGVREVIVFEGINDVGMLARGKNATAAEHAELVQRMEAVYTQIIERAHAQGLRVYGATMTPFVGSDYYKPTPENEADRVAVNEWIRQPGHFDAVVDFDQLTRDHAHPERLLPAYDSGDHLHPGPVGYKAMGEAVPLAWFR